jgi:hypothetical protein
VNIDPDRDFTYGHYRRILRRLKQTHAFVSFAGAEAAMAAGRRFVIMRHDVEMSLSGARTLAELDAEAGIGSTFFLLLTGEYNCFAEEGVGHVRAILALGHEVGLHYDGGLFTRLGLDPAGAARRQIALLEEVFGIRVGAMSAHMPMRSGVAFGLPGVINVYDRRYIADMTYVSDSVQQWRHGVVTALAETHRHIHLLTHECNWSAEGLGWEDWMRAEAGRRHAALSARVEADITVFREGLEARPARDPLFRAAVLGERRDMQPEADHG